MTIQIPNNAPVVFKSDWQHTRLEATDGTVIALDLQDVAKQVDEFTVADVTINGWINITNDQLGPGSQVTAVLIDKAEALMRPHYPMGQDVHVVELTHAGGTRFTAPFPEMTRGVSGAHYGERHEWEVAAVLDGDWKEDPISGQHNFKVDPAVSFYGQTKTDY
jgi:hypothetical protein